MTELLEQYFSKTGNVKDFNLYKKHYLELPRIEFAVIKISGESLDKHEDEVAESIAFLNRVGLYPIIVHGAGSLLDKRLGIPQKKDGLRITSKDDVAIIAETVKELGERLSKKIQAKGGDSEVVDTSIEAPFLNQEQYGYVGTIHRIKEAYIERLKAILAKGKTPIISCVGENKEEQVLLNINADTVAQNLLAGTGARKIIFLTETGGVFDEKKEIISSINIAELRKYDFITDGMLLKLEEIKKILIQKPYISVVITAPHNLIKEIFTIKGAGTYIKNHKICSKNSYENLDTVKIKNILEQSFNKVLKDSFFTEEVSEVFYNERYEAVSIIKQMPNNISYLCKFAVLNIRQGTGLGKSLWEKTIENHPKLIWKSRAGNQINTFYYEHCSGLVKSHGWIIFWRGIHFDDSHEVVKAVLKRQKDFIEP